MIFGELPNSAVLLLSPLAVAYTAAVEENDDIWSDVLFMSSSPVNGSYPIPLRLFILLA